MEGPERILLHTCCGPCAVHPHRALVEEGFRVTAFFYNPNIQPSREHRRRLDALRDFAGRVGLEVVTGGDYRPEEHLRATLDIHGDRARRCRACYDLRLGAAAEEASRRGFPAFTTTLLVSPYQLHDEVRRAGEAAAARTGGRVAFLYRDFRPGWKEGVAASREMGLYRQPYCGCLWSEVERYERPRS
ncbi:MAG TPA: hypothetical protein DHW14_00965 [Clostridiales bacterium]|nr:hypothetical protein [Clostridiales bacterium]